MGDFNSSDCSWKKMVIAKANNEWISTIKTEHCEEDPIGNSINLKQENVQSHFMVRNDDGSNEQFDSDPDCVIPVDPLGVLANSYDKPKRRTPRRLDSTCSVRRSMESAEGRATRLAKMSAYSARRLANESPEQRAVRLQRMSEYAARRIAQETQEQRAKRLARMSAYAARRLASETPEQRQARLAKMSAYSAKRQALKRATLMASLNKCAPTNIECNNVTQ